MAAFREESFKVVDFGIIRDQRANLRHAMVAAAGSCDVVVSSGGVSMGEADLVKPLLQELGEIHFGRLNMKPGKPTTFATLRSVDGVRTALFFALPGNPVSCLVCKVMSDEARPRSRITASISSPPSHLCCRPFAILIISNGRHNYCLDAGPGGGSSHQEALRGQPRGVHASTGAGYSGERQSAQARPGAPGVPSSHREKRWCRRRRRDRNTGYQHWESKKQSVVLEF